MGGRRRAGTTTTYEAQAVAARSYTLATLHPTQGLRPLSRPALADVRRHRRRAAADEPRGRRDRGPGARLARPDHPGLLLLDVGRPDVVGARRVADARTRCRISCRSAIRTTTSRRITSGRRRLLTASRVGSRAAPARASATRSWCATRRAARGRCACCRRAAGGVRRPGDPEEVQARLDRFRPCTRCRSTTPPARALYRDARARARLGARARAGAAPGAHRPGLEDGAPRARRRRAAASASSLRATRSTQLRLAYNGVAGERGLALRRAARELPPTGGRSSASLVSPRLPLQVQRLSQRRWTPVARANGAFDRSLEPGSYRVKVLGGADYGSAVSAPVGVHE